VSWDGNNDTEIRDTSHLVINAYCERSATAFAYNIVDKVAVGADCDLVALLVAHYYVYATTCLDVVEAFVQSDGFSRTLRTTDNSAIIGFSFVTNAMAVDCDVTTITK
jgi:hypothetical protein